MNKIIKFLIHPFHKQHEIYRESHFKGLEEDYKKKLLKNLIKESKDEK